MQSTQQQVQTYRKVLRRYLCYGCDRQFGTMVDVEGSNEIKCSSCGSDFVEEMRSIETNPQPARQNSPPAQPPQQQQIPQQIPSLFSQNFGAQQQRPQTAQSRRVVTQTVHRSNNRQPQGYTQSVTISYGNGSNEPQVQTFSSGNMGQSFQVPPINVNNTNNIQMNMMGGSRSQANLLGQMLSGRGGMPMMFSFNGDMEEESQSQGVSEEFIDNLPPMKADKEADCNICLEKVGTNGNKTCELPCGHAFDKACLTTWLKDHDSCPCCRVKLDQGRERPPTQQQQQPQMQNLFQGFFGF